MRAETALASKIWSMLRDSLLWAWTMKLRVMVDTVSSSNSMVAVASCPLGFTMAMTSLNGGAVEPSARCQVAPGVGDPMVEVAPRGSVPKNIERSAMTPAWRPP